MNNLLLATIASSRRRVAEFNTLDHSPALWLDSSVASSVYDSTSGGSLVSANGAIARLEDLSGNSRHYTQSTSGYRPLRKTSVYNGLDVVRFDGVDDKMIGPVIVSGTTARTIFMVAKCFNSGVVGMFGLGGGVSSIAGSQFDITPEIRVRAFQRQDFNSAMGTTSLKLLRIQCAANINIGSIRGWLNGTQMTGTPTGTYSLNTEAVSSTLGSGPGGSQVGINFAQLDLCEIRVFPSDFSTELCVACESQLTSKWAIS